MSHDRKGLISLALSAGLLLLAPPLSAGPAQDPTQQADLMEAGFLTGHPDLRHRRDGMQALEKGYYIDAHRHFKLAARYADKASQAMLAEMLWTGQGQPVDRAMAYVWMDLAAERGYEALVILREHYWAQLTEEERARAQRDGLALQNQYHDGVSKPRLAAVLRRERSRMTGSRTGYTGNPLRIISPGSFGGTSIDGNLFFDDRYWDPKQYQAWHDEVWQRPLKGRVEIGDVQKQPAVDAPANP